MHGFVGWCFVGAPVEVLLDELTHEPLKLPVDRLRDELLKPAVGVGERIGDLLVDEPLKV